METWLWNALKQLEFLCVDIIQVLFVHLREASAGMAQMCKVVP